MTRAGGATPVRARRSVGPRLAHSDLLAVGLAGTILAVAVALVALSLGRPEPVAYAPTPPAPADVGSRLAGPITYTVDAAAGDGWRFFDLSRGSVVEHPAPLGWDLAFRRFHIIANGGTGFAGAGGVIDLGPVAFDSVLAVPESGYRATEVRADSLNPGIAKWYDYGFTTHLLTPRPRVYAVRTADGRYAKLRILSYYCPGGRPGCVTFRYVYQGDGSKDLATGATDVSRTESLSGR